MRDRSLEHYGNSFGRKGSYNSQRSQSVDQARRSKAPCEDMMRNAAGMQGVTKQIASGGKSNRAGAAAWLAVLCALVADPVASERWVDIVGSSRFAGIAIDIDSVSFVAGYPDRVGAWILYTYSTSIDCSPPRNCYAASQRVYSLVNCAAQAIAPVQKISMDRNGDAIAQSDVNFNAPQYVVRPGTDLGDVWRSLCPTYPDRFEPP